MDPITIEFTPQELKAVHIALRTGVGNKTPQNIAAQAKVTAALNVLRSEILGEYEPGEAGEPDA